MMMMMTTMLLMLMMMMLMVMAMVLVIVMVVVVEDERADLLGEVSEDSAPDYDRPTRDVAGTSSLARARGREVEEKERREGEKGKKKEEKRDFWGELRDDQRDDLCRELGVNARGKKMSKEEREALEAAAEAFIRARESDEFARRSNEIGAEADAAQERMKEALERTRREVRREALRAGISEGELEAADLALRAMGVEFGESEVIGRERAKVELAKGIAKERGRSMVRGGARRKEDDESGERKSRRREEKKKEEEEERKKKEEEEKEERRRRERQRERDEEERRRREDKKLEKGRRGKGGRR